MQKPTLILSSAVLALTLGLTAFAAEPAKKDAPAAPVNKQCPVEGGEIDAEQFVVYKGKKVAFCCAGCDKEFNKDPEKYMKELAAKGDDNTIKKGEGKK
jgi:YHS domain-containing protein